MPERKGHVSKQQDEEFLLGEHGPGGCCSHQISGEKKGHCSPGKVKKQIEESLGGQAWVMGIGTLNPCPGQLWL